MPWTKGILFLTMAVLALSSSLRTDNGVVSEETIRAGKLVIGDQAKSSLAEAKLQRLGTTVHCGNDSMTLRVPGLRTPHFLVDQGEGSPVPLSEMPDSCGFSLKRVRRDVSLVAPYSGCHVRQQSGSYVLPLIIMGAPVKMSCPVSHRLPRVSCLSSAMIVSLGAGADDVQVKVAGSWQPLLLTHSICSFTLETVADSLVVTAPFTGNCWETTNTERHISLLYGHREITLSCPMTPTAPPPVPTVPVHDPAVSKPIYPFPFGGPWWNPYPSNPIAPPTTAATTTTTTPLPPPQNPFFPMYPMKGFDLFFYKGGPTRPPPTTTTTTTPPPPQDPYAQMFQYMYAMQNFAPYIYNQGAATTPPTTTTSTTTPPPPQDPYAQMFQYMYPMQNFAPYIYNQGAAITPPPTTTTTTTTTTTAPPQDPYAQMFQYMYPMQNFAPYINNQGAATTQPPTTTTTTPPPPQDPFAQMFQYMYPMQNFAPYIYNQGAATTQPPTTTPPPPQDPIPQQMFPFMQPMKGFDSYYFYKRARPYHRHSFSGFSPYMYGLSPDVTTPTPTAPQDVPYGGSPSMFYGSQSIKSFLSPDVQYPFMPQYRHNPAFGPRSLKPDSSSAQVTSVNRSRRHLLKVK